MQPETPTTPTKRTPPYVAYKTFINFVDSLKKAMPGRIDRSVMHTMSGGTQSHMTHALRSMELINDAGTTLDAFKDLVTSQGDERKQALTNCLVTGYPFLFDSKIDLETATGKQLLEQFENVGLRGDSIRKSVTFFLSAAKDAGMLVSPFFNKIQSRSGPQKQRIGVSTGDTASDELPKSKVSSPSPKRSKQEKDDSNGDAWAEKLLTKFPEFDPAWSDEVKLKWFEAFDRLMKGRGM
jgi:Family of unknown function (DUF5343)